MPSVRTFRRNTDGAVAPTVALSLFALIGVSGLAFDYARLAAMDTELQGAADQAALAAASQLDGQTGACARAAAAAAALVNNTTLFANDTSSRAITVSNESDCDAVGNVRFYQTYDKVTDTPGAAATSDFNANIVIVTVNGREAVYALTPVVAALRSGTVNAEAVAALGSAMCKVPPVMMCNPAEPATNLDPAYDFNPPEGAGLRLVIGSPDAPGNFGFLRTEESGAKGVAKMLGYDNPPYGCISTTGVETEPGNMISVRAAYNTRFDISESGGTTCPPGGTCSPSRNSRKDLVKKTGTADCGLSTNASSNDWHEAPNPYRAPNTNPLDAATNPMNATKAYPDTMGYPRDMCHAISLSGSCANGLVGNGAWDIDAYFKVNYGWDRARWMTETSLAASAAEVPAVSRYDVYKWEMANHAASIDNSQTIGTSGYSAYSSPICRAPGITPDATTPDRRRISVAVVNCHAQDLKGHETNVAVKKWLDVFLVEPAIQRGNGPSQRSTNGDIYVEVIGVSSSGTSGSVSGEVSRRDVPYLIR
jgi:Flp pilus assembly protein TadG